MTLAQKTDTELAELHHQRALASHDHHLAADAIHHYAGDEKNEYRDGRGRTHLIGWKRTLADCIEKGAQASHYALPLAREVASLEKHQARLDALAPQIAEREAIFAQHRWSRFFLVPGGHIHSSQSCHTCHPTTVFGWLPELSGLTEADAVAAHGALLCTICYPSAPVEWTDGRGTAKAERRCPGSGQRVEAFSRDGRTFPRTGVCPHCGEHQARLGYGALRAHDKPLPLCSGTTVTKYRKGYDFDRYGRGKCSACSQNVDVDRATQAPVLHRLPKPKGGIAA